MKVNIDIRNINYMKNQSILNDKHQNDDCFF
jgi:hypothetical protein